MSSSFIFDSTENSAVYLGKTHGVEEENHTARLCVGICQCKLVEGSQETTEVQVWLTVEQVAELVKQFFWEIVSPGNIYTKLLQRLLHRRRQMMTSEVAKTRLLGPQAGKPWMPQYDRLET